MNFLFFLIYSVWGWSIRTRSLRNKSDWIYYVLDVSTAQSRITDKQIIVELTNFSVYSFRIENVKK